jgi:hypothetical protein
MGGDWKARVWQALESHVGMVTGPDDIVVATCELWSDMNSRERLACVGFYQYAREHGVGFDPRVVPLKSEWFFGGCEYNHPPENLLTH